MALEQAAASKQETELDFEKSKGVEGALLQPSTVETVEIASVVISAAAASRTVEL